MNSSERNIINKWLNSDVTLARMVISLDVIKSIIADAYDIGLQVARKQQSDESDEKQTK